MLDKYNMKKFFLWFLAFVITIGSAYYQRLTGPTNPKRENIILNGNEYELKLVRSLSLDEPSRVKLHIQDPGIKAKLYYKRFRSNEEYTANDFSFKAYPVISPLMNKVFKITEEKGYFADIPQQPPAGKIEYYIEITSGEETLTLFRNSPVVIRFKGSVPGIILLPHILLMFVAMFFSNLAGIMSLIKYPYYKRYAWLTLIFLLAGGMILGPLVQKYAFGDLWTGVPFGWDLTDNKILVAVIFWIFAVARNRNQDKPLYIIIAALVLIVIYSVPHSLFGSELDFETGRIIQGIIMIFFIKNMKFS
jgi:hypothetical protein